MQSSPRRFIRCPKTGAQACTIYNSGLCTAKVVTLQQRKSQKLWHRTCRSSLGTKLPLVRSFNQAKICTHTIIKWPVAMNFVRTGLNVASCVVMGLSKTSFQAVAPHVTRMVDRLQSIGTLRIVMTRGHGTYCYCVTRCLQTLQSWQKIKHQPVCLLCPQPGHEARSLLSLWVFPLLSEQLLSRVDRLEALQVCWQSSLS